MTGLPLTTLFLITSKHNEANKEENRDGNNDNLSWNCGAEGQTDDAAIERLRNRQVKNFLTLTLLSIGAPMILMGDEVRRTQQGNNNAYCQNNELGWFDWSLIDKHADIHNFVKHLIHVRLQLDVSQAEYSMSLNQLLNKSLITWHGVKLNQPDWSRHSHSVAFTVQSLSGTIAMHFHAECLSRCA
jgi:glycogen operon protein